MSAQRVDLRRADMSLRTSPRRLKWNRPVMIEVAEAVDAIVVLHDADGGATFSLHHGSLSGQKLYAVSIYLERSVRFIGRSIPPDLLTQFISGNLALLAESHISIGTWFN